MNITTENLSDLHLKVKVNLEPNDYLPKVEESIRSLSKKISLPGFRPGKVPVGMTRKMHGNELLAEELNKIVGDSIDNYIKEHNLNIFGQPIPSEMEEKQSININEPSPLHFDFEMGLIPSFEIADLKKENEFSLYDIQLEEANVNEEIEKFRVRFGTTSETDTIGTNDALDATFSELNNEGNVKEGGVNSTTRISITSIADKNITDKILTLQKGEHIDFNINETFGNNHELIVHNILKVDHHTADEMGTQFRMTINSIHHIEKATVNQELFDKVFGEGKIKSEEEMRTKISEEMKQQYARMAEQRLTYDLMEAVIEKTKIDLPVEFLKKWIIASNDKPVTFEQIEKEFDAITRQVKWDLITEKIVKDNNIEITPEELRKYVTDEFAGHYFGGQITEEMEKSLQNITNMILDNEKNRKDYINRLLEIKIFEVLKKNANIAGKEISLHDYTHA